MKDLLQLTNKTGIDIEEYFEKKLPKLVEDFSVKQTKEEYKKTRKEYRETGKNKIYE